MVNKTQYPKGHAVDLPRRPQNSLKSSLKSSLKCHFGDNFRHHFGHRLQSIHRIDLRSDLRSTLHGGGPWNFLGGYVISWKICHFDNK